MISHAVTVVIPTIPPRAEMLSRAVASVLAQSYPATAISIAVDHSRRGASATRHEALMAVQTPWVAFLDDDDEFMPDHLESLIEEQILSRADYVYSWYQMVDSAGNHLPDTVLGHFGIPYNTKTPHQTTITTLVRTDIAKEAGFTTPPKGEKINGQVMGEDFIFTLKCIEEGASIVHLPKVTWYWHHHGANTSGQPDRW